MIFPLKIKLLLDTILPDFGSPLNFCSRATLINRLSVRARVLESQAGSIAHCIHVELPLDHLVTIVSKKFKGRRYLLTSSHCGLQLFFVLQLRWLQSCVHA
ncbi:hypothetical protein MKW98_026459, partial [Papaver atlanticum]